MSLLFSSYFCWISFEIVSMNNHDDLNIGIVFIIFWDFGKSFSFFRKLSFSFIKILDLILETSFSHYHIVILIRKCWPLSLSFFRHIQEHEIFIRILLKFSSVFHGVFMQERKNNSKQKDSQKQNRPCHFEQLQKIRKLLII